MRASSIVAWTFLACANGAQVHIHGQEQADQPRLSVSAETPLGLLSGGPMYWHIHEFPTRAAAEAARGPRGTVADVFDRHWLYMIADAEWRPAAGERIARIGPLDVAPNTPYTARQRGVRSRGSGSQPTINSDETPTV